MVKKTMDIALGDDESGREHFCTILLDAKDGAYFSDTVQNDLRKKTEYPYEVKWMLQIGMDTQIYTKTAKCKHAGTWSSTV